MKKVEEGIREHRISTSISIPLSLIQFRSLRFEITSWLANERREANRDVPGFFRSANSSVRRVIYHTPRVIGTLNTVACATRLCKSTVDANLDSSSTLGW